MNLQDISGLTAEHQLHLVLESIQAGFNHATALMLRLFPEGRQITVVDHTGQETEATVEYTSWLDQGPVITVTNHRSLKREIVTLEQVTTPLS